MKGCGRSVGDQQKENLNRARGRCFCHRMLCEGAGDFCHACVLGGLSGEAPGICIRQMGVISILY